MNTIIKIGNKFVGTGHSPFIIAEMACAHDGSFDKAKKIIDAAADAQADAIQLQFFFCDTTVTPHHEVYQVLKRIQFSEQQWTELFQYARSKNIFVFVCTYDMPSVKLAMKLKADGIKLNSSDLSNPEIIIAVAESGIPFTLGTGAQTMDEIKNGLEIASKHGAENSVLMYGVQNFPTKIEDLNILKILILKEKFGIPVGYQDHTDAEDPFSNMVDLIAVGMGANIIEKHITLNRAEKGIDHQASLNPNEFKAFVKNIRTAFVALGSKEIKPFSESDLRYRKFQKKSIVAAKNIMKGEKISKENVLFIRNVIPGLSPAEFTQVSGKIAVRDITAYENIIQSDVA